MHRRCSRPWSWLVLGVALAVPASAQAQIAPRMVLGFDTSGSMALDVNGVPTFGDGVLDGCTRMAAGHYCGTDCAAGIDTNCDGLPDDSRIFVAKEAVRNMVLSTGDDVEWALSRFDQTHTANGVCNAWYDPPPPPTGYFRSAVQDVECLASFSSYGNPQCGTDPIITRCGNLGGGNWLVDTADFPAACRPGSGSNPPLRELNAYDTLGIPSDGNPLTNPLVCIDYVPDSCDATAASGNLLVGFSGLGAYAGRSNVPGILKWIDNTQTSFRTTTATGNWCDHATVGDCELTPVGRTPLAGILQASRDYMVGVRTGDPAATCRPYSIVLLTDGVETCDLDPTAPATRAGVILAADGIRTYVVGMSISDAGERTNLNNIAVQGGTSNAFFANDPDSLAAALADIVADSLLIEICNNVDDNCNGLIDEGFTKYCNRPAGITGLTLCANPGETRCDGVDDNCNGLIDEGLANACGTCGAVPVEICDGLDNDCDGIIDEGGVCSGCIVSAEICDGLDNDCDGSIDEGLTRVCGTDVGDCVAGTQTCAAGRWGACSGTGPGAEVCDGRDNDCDGITDGMSRPCGSDVGACQAGAQMCMGTWGACTGAIGPATEICDGLDNDCDGSTDESNPGGGGTCGSSIGACMPGTLQCRMGALTCIGGVSPIAETCNGIDDDCDGTVDDGVPSTGPCGSAVGECRRGAFQCVGGTFTCVGGRGATTEVCDGLDNDCDGSTDEGNPGGGVACGTDTGVCSLGTSRCMGGALVCMGGVSPGTEVCNGLDDDCDGLVDEGNPGGGGTCGTTDVGECDFGRLACAMGALVCVGERGPRPELCDGLDNDCDGMTDEGNPEGGAPCGDGTGECEPGVTRCTAGMLECMGGVGPTTEICDGLDNDCDGVADEGLGVGLPCGTDEGECVPGVYICRDGAPVCEGAVGPIPEVCDTLDNDCDGMVDEGLPVGAPCGTDEGLCMAGTLQCVGGRDICVGEVPPTRELCDCDDNDCDGMIDEPPASGTLCPGGSTCIECQCALPCVMSEFGFTCPTGKAPRVDGDTCFCVRERCNADTCATETVERDGAALCEPDSTDVSHCVCKNNECTFPCDGAVCAVGLVCNPRDPAGRCADSSCRGLGCAAGELCNVVSGECEADPCATTTCAPAMACIGGECVGSCASVTCSDGERCERGDCVADYCAGVGCLPGQVCNPVDGSCTDDLCAGVLCPAGSLCNPVSGECELDPCLALHCPMGQRCTGGECVLDTTGTDAGVDAGFDAGAREPDGMRVLATGGGGCVCAVPGSRPAAGTGALGLCAFVALLGFVVARRRRRRLCLRSRARALLVALVSLALAAVAAGCDVDPYCIGCRDGSGGGDGGPVDAGRRDAGRRDSGTPDAGPVDAGPDGCVPGAPELCNGRDDNCDGTVDEGFDLTTDPEHCGSCETACAPAHAFGECVASTCGLASCDVGWYDLNGGLDDGCEYRCLPTESDDTICDLRDNDCDGMVDEDVDLDTDPANCGTCGLICRFAHAAATCVAGDCTLGACDAGFHDVDGVGGNGCEYACTAAMPPTEVCNGRDEDCDGMIDEGDPGSGATCGTSAGECSTGVNHCVDGAVQCVGAVTPTTELCNGRDDDCDGTVDQGNPEGGALCGSGVGTCAQGRERCMGGMLRCIGATAPVAERCDGLDNDCDGMIDEGDPDGGTSCGLGAGACTAGTEHCRGGVVVCEEAVGPTTEICNGADDDCDGMTDEGNPGGGTSCGTDVGECTPGTNQCMGGRVVCVGGRGPAAEACDNLDNDCDGMIDEGNPGGGASCGSSVGACRPGTNTCLGGTIQCVGATGPTLEICNSVDDDCDGMTDEGFDLTSDIRNCGMCGRTCGAPHAIYTCASRACLFVACETGWFDRNGMASDGCEYACDYAGSEICNGLDDDCDGVPDDGLVPPSTFCNPNGVCSTVRATCSGGGGWVCNYGSVATYEADEVTCDGLDNDCDGARDEPFPLVGTSCANGVGECRRTGTYVCNMARTGTTCNAGTPGSPRAELCDNIDNDCNGAVDNGVGAASSSAVATVRIPRASGAGFVRVMAYEASHPDATSSAAGSVTSLACSTANRLPWSNVTWTGARDACCALNASGTCTGGLSGWTLCDARDWQAGCRSTSGTCTWAYSASCSASQPLLCNGDEYDCSGAAGDQDCLFPTGSATFPSCRVPWTGGSIYDMSGNVKEWTLTQRGSPAFHEIRGGSYNNVEAGRTCTFNFTIGDNNFSFPHTGFRCCYYE